MSFLAPKIVTIAEPSSLKINLSVENILFDTFPDILSRNTDLGAMSEGLNIKLKANKVMDFKRNNFSINNSFSGQLKNKAEKHLTGIAVDLDIGTVVPDLINPVISLLIFSSKGEHSKFNEL